MKSLSAAEILKLTPDQPERLFSGDVNLTKSEYRKLAFKWHPDQNPDVDGRVMATINELYRIALQRLEGGTWVTPGEVTFKTIDGGRTYVVKHHTSSSFELGEIYVGRTIIVYALTKDNGDLFARAQETLKGLKYASTEMKTEMSKYTPTVQAVLETADRLVMVVSKQPGQFFLTDVLDHLTKVPPKHVAWMLSRLYNFACFLKYNKVVHGGIMSSSIVVDPLQHTMSVVGGWWYSAKEGNALKALPRVAGDNCSPLVLLQKKAVYRIDLELVRALGRYLLGDVHGSRLIMDKDIPLPLLTWLRTPAGDDAVKEYEAWQKKVLIDSFGPRKFIELKLSHNDLYGDPR